MAMWFPEQNANQIGRVEPVSSSLVIAAAVLPGSRAVQIGTTATVFATIVNGGAGTAQGCAIAPTRRIGRCLRLSDDQSGDQCAVRHAEHAADIPAHGAQTYVLELTPGALRCHHRRFRLLLCQR
ncbi:MAG: hypothetical protein WDN69_31650 [Aliidongia sp.]